MKTHRKNAQRRRKTADIGAISSARSGLPEFRASGYAETRRITYLLRKVRENLRPRTLAGVCEAK